MDSCVDLTGKFLATVSFDGTTTIFKLNMRNSFPTQIAEVKPKNPKPAWCVKWADPRFDLLFAVCYFDHNIVIYQLQEDKKINALFTYNMQASVNKCDFASWGLGLKLVAVSSEGRGVVIAREETTFKVTQFDAHDKIATSVSWAPACSLHNFIGNKGKNTARSVFATAGCDGNISMWEYAKDDNGTLQVKKIGQIDKAHTPYVRDISWSNNGFVDNLILASGGEDKLLRIYKVEFQPDGKATATEVFHKTYDSPVWKVGFNYSGNLLAVSYTNQQEVATVEVLAEREKHKWEPVTDSKGEN